MKSLRVCLALLALFAGPPLVAEAQAPWMLDVAAGYSRPHAAAAAPLGEAGSLMLGVRRNPDEAQTTYLYGGVPFDTAGVLWLAAGARRRPAREVGGLTLGAEAGLHLLGYRDAVPTWAGGATLELLPFLQAERGPLSMELRSGVVQHTDLYAGTASTRRVHDSGVRLGIAPAPGVRLLGEARYVRAPEDGYPFVGATLEAVRGRAAAWLVAGRWLSDSLPTPIYGVGAAWQLGGRWEIHALWQQEARHPLYWNPPRRAWSVGVSRVLGRRSAAVPLLAAPVRDAEGRITLRIPLAEAPSAPFVLGDFTGWRPVPMQREGEFWSVRLAIEPGVYRYGFQDAEGRWFLPPSVTQRVDDGMGGTSGLLVVP